MKKNAGSILIVIFVAILMFTSVYVEIYTGYETIVEFAIDKLRSRPEPVLSVNRLWGATSDEEFIYSYEIDPIAKIVVVCDYAYFDGGNGTMTKRVTMFDSNNKQVNSFVKREPVQFPDDSIVREKIVYEYSYTYEDTLKDRAKSETIYYRDGMVEECPKEVIPVE